MNILLTGANGFIGRSFVNAYKSKYKIFSITRNPSNNLENNIAIDLTDSDAATRLAEALNNEKIDLILHGAARLIEPGKADDLSVLHDNLKITENINLISKLLKPSAFIHLSTIAVYPNTDGEFSEDSAVNPSVNTEGIYGLSKVNAENLIDFAHKDSETTVTHLRLAQVYGEGMRSDRIHSIMLDDLKRSNSITVFGDGERVSNFIAIERLLPVIDFFIENNESGTYNLGDENLSYFELAESIIEAHGNRDSKISKNSNGSRSKFILNTTRLRNLLNQKGKSELLD